MRGGESLGAERGCDIEMGDVGFRGDSGGVFGTGRGRGGEEEEEGKTRRGLIFGK